MLEKFFYYLTTFAEAGLAIFGIVGPFEQPAYTVIATLPSGIEIRRMAPVTMIESTAPGASREEASSAAFRALFGYIAGGNAGGQAIAMTTPVRMDAQSQTMTMRFYLPAKYAANPPVPSDPGVRLVTMPATTVAVRRFGGNPTAAAFEAQSRLLLDGLARSNWRAAGTPWLLAYNPPFTIPFLKRNEAAVRACSTINE